MFDQGLAKEITDTKEVFTHMETEVETCFVERKYFEIKKKELFIENDRLLEHIICQDVMGIAMHADFENNCVLHANEDNLEYAQMKQSYIDEYSRCVQLEVELSKTKDMAEKDVKIDDPTLLWRSISGLRKKKLVDTLTSEAALSCEPTVSSLNNDEIDFRISFDESDDEDCTVIFDKNSFSYKIIYVNNLKTDSENDNDKVNMPLLPSPKPTVSYFDDLDFFKDFKNEFPAIVYNDAQTSKSDLLTEPILNPQHIDEFNLKDETSLSECDEEEQNVLNFNYLFPFNVIYPNDSKSDTDNNDDKVDIELSSWDLFVKPLCDVINTDVGAYAQRYQDRNALVLPIFYTGPRERNIDEVGGMHIF
ncbi:hypothetical protein Tco_0524009 [Tanacetum coccineum]